jgi:hypothetical protein
MSFRFSRPVPSYDAVSYIDMERRRRIAGESLSEGKPGGPR